MNYREPLPNDCPPPEASEIADPRIVFRLVRLDPPTLDDFRSQRDEQPTASFRLSECQARGLSVFAVQGDCQLAAKLPKFRGRLVCRVNLRVGSGFIQQTNRPSHHTWWPFANYDILSQCEVAT